MKKLLFTTILLSFAVTFAFGQKRQPTAKVQPKTVAAQNKTTTAGEISEADWLRMADAMYLENWEKSSTLAAQNLQKLKAENARKQLAQLRYVYLYSLAGKAAEGKLAYAELERIANTLIGQEFMLVSRQILADCNTKLNYICATKDGGDRVLRVTATNRSGTAIHLFEYVALNQRFDVRANSEKLAFVGGNLKKVESTTYKTDIKVMRLIFDKGYVKLATD